jgi:prophage regulatory protein
MANEKINFELPETGFIRQKDLLKIIPFSAATLWRNTKAGTFPKVQKLSERVSAWRVEDVRAWMGARTNGGAG